MRNVTLALRSLARTPIVTIVAALSLGLGIGSNAAIYSIFHQMLRQDLRVHEPTRLVNFGAPGPKPGSNSCGQAGPCSLVFSYPMFRDLQKAQIAGLASFVGHRDFGANVSYDKHSSAEEGMVVSGNYFGTLGVQPALGRLLKPSDDEVEGTSPVVVLGYYYWEHKLGADSSVVGKTITINGKPQTIVGVAQKGFNSTVYGSRPAFFAPLAMSTALGNRNDKAITDRRDYWIYAFGRLTPSGSIDQVRMAINKIYSPIIQDEAPLQKGMRDSILPKFKAKQITVAEGRRGQSDFEEAKGPLFLLFAITGLVLLIACANIANLLLARATNREMEMAVRLSLGATRRQLLAQLLTESVTLAVIGGVTSLLFASWTISGVNALLPEEITGPLELGLNWAAVYFAAIVSIATGIAFGLFPALHSTRPDLVTAMRNSSGKLAGGRTARRFRTSLATAQIALAMALLMSSGLFLKSLWKITRVDTGVKIERLVTFRVEPEQSGYDSTRMRQLYDRIDEGLGTIPAVTGVSSTMVPLLANSQWTQGVKVEGFKSDEDHPESASFNGVAPGHFHTIGVDLLAGREFRASDVATSPKVVIVNETFARHFGLGANPVGKHMGIGSRDTTPLDIEIVGLVRDSKYSSVKRETPPVFFRPHKQMGRVGEMNYYVRTDGDPNAIIRQIPQVVQRLDPLLPVERLRTMPETIRENMFEDRMISTLSSSFAVLATLLAAIGLYGVLAYSVAQRTREIGVRMALGAASAQVQRMVLRQVGVMTLIGGVIGIGAAIALGKVAQSMLYKMSGADPVVMAIAVVALSLVALAAGYVPALRASRVDPMQALRYE